VGAEKRQFDRKDFELPLRVEVGAETLDGVTSNLSLGGARVDIPKAMTFGTKVKVHVRLPALAEESVVEAEVRWCQPGEAGRFFVGLQFLRVRARETWALNQLVRPPT